jgi:hypothetical protein
MWGEFCDIYSPAKEKGKKIVENLSGRPKSGNIVECITPITGIPMFLFSLLFMILAIKFKSFTFGFLSIIFAWQIGWGMSIERFNNNEKRRSK